MIGLMTGSIKKPYDVVEIPESLIRIVADALSVAWRILLEQQDHASLSGYGEDEITEKLYMILSEIDDDPIEELRELALLQSPVREGNIRNYDNTHPDKQPDLTWRPVKGLLGKVGNTATAGIFVECKPIDRAHPVGSTYCKNGLIRFVNGDYSWRVNRAMMVGYVRNFSKLPGVLQTSLEKPEIETLLGYRGPLNNEKNTIKGDAVWSSLHKRTFKINSQPVGNIQVDHLWLYPLEPFEASKGRGSS